MELTEIKVSITVDIGSNLKDVIQNAIITNSTRGGTSIGEEIQKAFKIDFTKITQSALGDREEGGE